MKDLFTDSLKNILVRDLSKLEEELKLYPDAESIWKIKGNIKNPAGNLCLHLCGNLQYYIGAVLGNTGYVRNRDLEFSAKNVPLETLLKEISQAKLAIQSTLPRLTEKQLQENYPVDVFGNVMTTTFFLIHLVSHFGYHLGQVNYHRRLITAK